LFVSVNGFCFINGFVIFSDLPTLDLNAIQSKLAARHISFVVNRDLPGQDGQKAVYYFARTLNNSNFLIELKFKAGMNVCKVSVRSVSKPIAEYCKLSVAKILLAQQ